MAVQRAGHDVLHGMLSRLLDLALEATGIFDRDCDDLTVRSIYLDNGAVRQLRLVKIVGLHEISGERQIACGVVYSWPSTPVVGVFHVHP